MFFIKIAHTIRATPGPGRRAAGRRAGRHSRLGIQPRTVKLTLTGSGTAAKAQMKAVLQSAGLAPPRSRRRGRRRAIAPAMPARPL